VATQSESYPARLSIDYPDRLNRLTTFFGRQKVGGLAALYLALAYVVAMPYFLVFVKYQSAVDPVEKVALLVGNHNSMQAMHLITYVIFGLVLAVVALGLHARLNDGAPILMQAATAVGLIWAVVLVASGMIFNAGMAAVVGLHATSPGQAVSAWQAIEPVTDGLGGSGGEVLGGLWVLLVSLAALRTQGLPKVLNWLGVVIGAAGVLSVVPALNDVGYVFGLLQIVWFVGLGIKPGRFNGISPFSEGLAAVATEKGSGFIDTRGAFVIEPRFESAQSFSQGLAAVSVGGKVGFVDTSGLMVIAPRFEEASRFSDGFAPVRTEGKWGYIDTAGNLVIQPRFDQAFPFSEGRARVVVGDTYGYIDASGASIVDPWFAVDLTQRNARGGDFSDGLALVGVDKKFGYIDTRGRYVVEPRFWDGNTFSHGRAAVLIDGKYGFIDTTGAWAITPRYTGAGDF
jgi:hypothetical protein